MKRSVLFFSLFIGIPLTAQTVNIPDANFKNALLNHNPTIDTNGDGDIQVSEAQGFYGSLYLFNKNISDLTGIEAFIHIGRLKCANNNLTTLDLSQHTLLEGLYCGNNQLTSLILSPSLAYLSCGSNQLSTLDLSQSVFLKDIIVSNNQLTTLDISQNPDLVALLCQNNQLVSLDIRNGNNSNIILFQRRKP